MSVVLDASTSLAAVLPDENSAFARSAIAACLRDGLLVPALWPYEVQNALVMALRRNRIGAQALNDALASLRDLGANIEAPHGLGRELRLAQAYGLSTYDAAYLAVALDSSAVLATNDERLRSAATAAGVALFEEPTRKSRKSRVPTGKRT